MTDPQDSDDEISADESSSGDPERDPAYWQAIWDAVEWHRCQGWSDELSLDGWD